MSPHLPSEPRRYRLTDRPGFARVIRQHLGASDRARATALDTSRSTIRAIVAGHRETVGRAMLERILETVPPEHRRHVWDCLETGHTRRALTRAGYDPAWWYEITDATFSGIGGERVDALSAVYQAVMRTDAGSILRDYERDWRRRVDPLPVTLALVHVLEPLVGRDVGALAARGRTPLIRKASGRRGGRTVPLEQPRDVLTEYLVAACAAQDALL